MTKIWKETGFVAKDAWVIETDEVKAGEGETPIYALDAFLAAAAETNGGGLGVLVAPADDVQKLEPYLDRIALIAIAFPAFSDGRGFSHAALLRERLDYQGELRAVGDVLIDQVPLNILTFFLKNNVLAHILRYHILDRIFVLIIFLYYYFKLN